MMINAEKPCAFCDNPAHDGRRLCKDHLQQQRLKMAQYRASRKAKWLCSRCPNTARTMPNGQPSTLCDKCRTHVRGLEAKRDAV